MKPFKKLLRKQCKDHSQLDAGKQTKQTSTDVMHCVPTTLPVNLQSLSQKCEVHGMDGVLAGTHFATKTGAAVPAMHLGCASQPPSNV